MNLLLKKIRDQRLRFNNLSIGLKVKSEINKATQFGKNTAETNTMINSVEHGVPNKMIDRSPRMKALLMKSFMSTKLSKKNMKLLMKKLRDKKVKTYNTELNLKMQSHVMRSRGGHGLNDKLAEIKIGIGKLRQIANSPIINKNPRIFNFLQKNYFFKKNINKKFNLMLKKLKDKHFRNDLLLLNLSQKMWFGKTENANIKTDQSETSIGKFQFRPIVDRRYPLAVMNCFEKSFGSFKFRTWNELHTAMKQYLDGINEKEVSEEEIEKVRRTLPFLRPLFKYGSFNFGRIYSLFQEFGQTKIERQFENSRLIDGLKLMKNNDNTKTEFLRIIEISGAYLPDQQMTDLKEEILNNYGNENILEKFDTFESKCLVKVDSFKNNNFAKEEDAKLAKELSVKLNLIRILRTKIKSIVDLKKQLFIF